MSRNHSEYKPPPRPPSEQLSDVHVYIVPTEIWRKRYNNLLNSSVTETVSIGIIRIHPEIKVYLLRDELEQQIGTELLPREFVFLKSVGRSLTRLKPKQEYQLKAKTFLPPNAYSSELYLLESSDFHGQFGPGSSDASTRTQTRNSFRATDEGYSSYKDGNQSSRLYPDDTNSRNYYNLHNGHASGHDPAKLKSRHSSAAARHASALSHEYSLDPKYGGARSDSSAPYISNSGEWTNAKYEPRNTDHDNNADRKGQRQQSSDSRQNDSNVRGQRDPSGGGRTNDVNARGQIDSKGSDANVSHITEHSDSRPNISINNNTEDSKTDIRPELKGGNSQLHNDSHVDSRNDQGHYSEERDYHRVGKDSAGTLKRQASFSKRTGRSISRSNSRAGSNSRRSIDRKSKMDRTHHSHLPSSEHQRSTKHDKAPSSGDYDKQTSDYSNNMIPDSRIGGYSPENQHRSRYRDEIESPRRSRDVVEDSAHDQQRGYDDHDGSPSRKNHRHGGKHGAYRQGKSDDDEQGRQSQDRLNDSHRKDDGRSDDRRERRRRHGSGEDDDDYHSDENDKRVKHKRRGDGSDGDDHDHSDDDENRKPGNRRKRRGDRKDDDYEDGGGRTYRRDQSDEELNRFPSPPGIPRGSLEPFEDISKIHDKDRLMEILEKQRAQRKAAEKEREDLVKKVKAMQNKTQNRRNFARDIWKKRYFEEKKKTPPLEEQCNKLRQELDVLHRRLMTTLEGPKERHIKLNDKQPSLKNNYKLQAIKLQHEIEDMRRRVENSKMKLTAEMKLRNQAETELRALRAELTQKKINLSLTRTSQLAALTAPDKLPAIQNTKQPITPRS